MKKTLLLVLALMLTLTLMSGAFAEEKELRSFIYVLPRTVEALEDSPFHVAEVMGFLAEEGLTMELIEAFGTTDMRMVATGQAQFCAPGPALTLAGIAEGLGVKVVMAYDAINIWGLAVLTDSPVQSFEDMQNAQEKYGRKLTVALGDAAWEMLVTPTFIAGGVNVAEDLEFVVAGENRYVQVAEGKLDMLFTWPGECWQLIGQNYDFKYIDGHDVLKTNSNSIITSQKLIDEDPEMVQGFVRALSKALHFIHYNPEAAAAIMADQFPNVDVTWKAANFIQAGRLYQMFGAPGSEEEATALNNIGFSWEDRWMLNVQAALDAGVIDKELTADEIFTNQFVDNSWDRKPIEELADSVDIETVKARYQAE